MWLLQALLLKTKENSSLLFKMTNRECQENVDHLVSQKDNTEEFWREYFACNLQLHFVKHKCCDIYELEMSIFPLLRKLILSCETTFTQEQLKFALHYWIMEKQMLL